MSGIQQRKIDQIIAQPAARNIDQLWDEYRVITDPKERDEFVGALIGTLVSSVVAAKSRSETT